jgi:hypothetical protein
LVQILVTSAGSANGGGYGAVLRFDTEGELLAPLSEDPRITDPRGLCLDPSGTLIYLNSGEDRVLALRSPRKRRARLRAYSRAHASSPRPCESDTRCKGLDTDRPETTRRQFGLTNVCCQSRLTAMNAEDIASAIASNDPSLGLRAALALRRLAERVEADHVATARQQGWSWQQIGDALGVTRQSVHAKYGKRLR